MSQTAPRRGRRTIQIHPDDLPNRARPLRETRGLTLQEAATMAGTTANLLSEFERTGQGIALKIRFALAEALGVDYGSLMMPGKNFVEKVRSGGCNSNLSGV